MVRVENGTTAMRDSRTCFDVCQRLGRRPALDLVRNVLDEQNADLLVEFR